MNKKIYGIVLIVIGLAVVGCLHQFVFAPKKAELAQYKQDLSSLEGRYKRIVSDIKKEQGSVDDIGGAMDRIISKIEENNTLSQESFEKLDQQLKLIDHFDPSANYRNEIFSEINRMQQLEQGTQITKLRVSNSWGVNHGIRDGKYGTGYYAEGGRSMAFSNIGLRQVINPKSGTVEFWVKPDWDPNDREIHHKCMFMAIHIDRKSREDLQAQLEAKQDELGRNQVPQLPLGQGMVTVENYVAIYKGEGPTLTFELKDGLVPSTVTANISDWKPDQWYLVSGIWESKRQALYVNGQNKGVPFMSGVSIRDARDEDELGLDMLGMGMGGMGMGGMGMGMGMMGMGGMGM
ncbi:hypothetical protein K8I31_01535, partial [bacterium]|nr:hypothetical protein [bacterium]